MKDWGDKPINVKSGPPVSMADAVRRVIRNYPANHEFHGNELHNDVATLYPEAKTMYTDTVQRAMRRHCRHLVKCVNQNESLYKKIGAEQLENAAPYGKAKLGE
jgi:hypothetical protein